ncbi:unnamed protein product [Lasius platythorax]|uniref:Uncharacterized protein n=1 Tax=Lasius platythorax TaxID=488582 RepID=A0AAV2N6Q3_9HYME
MASKYLNCIKAMKDNLGRSIEESPSKEPQTMAPVRCKFCVSSFALGDRQVGKQCCTESISPGLSQQN